MEIKKYRLQTEMENLKEGNEEWFKDYVRGVLESNKPYFEKADYIAYSINQISNKLDYISNEIKELQELKKFLSNSKELAMQITASILTNEYGISKLESGVSISSITITPEKSKTSQVIMGPFIILCQLGKIKNTKGHKDENRNRCRAIC